MKTSTQLKALVRNLSKLKNVEAEIILRNFMMERLLERISASQYKDKFILKGGMLIAAMVGIDARTTMDLDATIKGQNLSEAEIVATIEGILKVSIDDGVILTYRGIEEIREESDYPGYRVSIEALFDKTRQALKVDITTGDFITPKEIEYNFRLMFEERTISIMAYNLETVLAEKFETIITRGLTNTRMRDFYDVYILTATRSQDIDLQVFPNALKSTAEKRNTSEQMADASNVISIIAKSAVMIDLWKRYQTKYSYAEDVSWEMVIDALTTLVKS
jgi:predicted nucleotidyltransferase component of viral defense system